MPHAKKSFEINLKPEERPSRFMVDLSVAPEEEKALIDEPKKNPLPLDLLNNLGKKAKESGSRLADTINSSKERFKRNKIHALNDRGILYSLPDAKPDFSLFRLIDLGRHSHNISRLTITPLLVLLLNSVKLAAKLLYRISYRSGWLLIYGFRFFYFAFVFSAKGLRNISEKLKPNTGVYGTVQGEIAYPVSRAEAMPVRKDKALYPYGAAVLSLKENKGGESFSGRSRETVSPEPAVRPKFSFVIRQAAVRQSSVFFCLLVLIVSPLRGFTFYNDMSAMRGRVMGITENALASMAGAAGSVTQMDFTSAENSFLAAQNDFFEARQQIKDIKNLLSVIGAIPLNGKLNLAARADELLEAGEISANIGFRLNMIIDKALSAGDNRLYTVIESLYEESLELNRLSDRLIAIIESISPADLPAEVATAYGELYARASALRKGLDEFFDIIKAVRIISGFESDKRYLLIFQNNTELRATGGFIGSYALADMSRGEIKSIEVPGGGAYDTEGSMRLAVESPWPLHIINPRWFFWDCNWWPDWKLSSEKLMWFYEKSGGPSVDGVVSFTPTVMEELLKLFGPLDLSEKYGQIISAENFWLTTQLIVENKENGGDKPKLIIGDMLEVFLDKMKTDFNKEKLLAMISLLERNLAEKQILLYFKDGFLEQKTKEYGWDGRVKNTNLDYLLVVHTNIAGAKTDRVIKDDINHAISIEANGEIIDTLTIKRSHTGIKGDPLTGVGNNDWLRIYVPRGSELLSARGFSKIDSGLLEEAEDDWYNDPDLESGENRAAIHVESGTKVYDELNKTVFANWLQVKPGESVSAVISYRLPFRIERDRPSDWTGRLADFMNPNRRQLMAYSLLVQKQPGTSAIGYSSSLDIKYDARPYRYLPSEELRPEKSGWRVNTDLQVDKFYALTLTSN